MTRRIDVELLGARVGIEVPDDGWYRFVRKLWGPFVVDGEAAGGPPLVEIGEEPVWGWRLESRGERLWQGRDPWFLIGELRYWVVRHAVEQASLYLLHASMVSRAGRAVLLLAASGRGKTTLSLHLAAHGWRYHGDDLAAIDPDTLLVTGVATPAGIRDVGRWDELEKLWDGTAPAPPTGDFLIPAGGPGNGDLALPVDALGFIEFAAGASPTLERITAAEATLLCAEHGIVRDRPAVGIYAALCRATRCGRLRYGSSDAAAALLEELLAGT